jgi:hypothetical protein
MKKILILLSLSLGCFCAHSQKFDAAGTGNGFNNNLRQFAVQKIEKVSNGSSLYSDKAPDIYLFEKFTDSEIHNISTKDSVLKAKTNYNILKDRFEILINDDLYLVDKNVITKIIVGGKTFKPSASTNKNYYELITSNNNVKLIAYNEGRFIEARTQTLGIIETKIKKIIVAGLIINNNEKKMPKKKTEVFDLLQLNDKKRKEFKKIKLKNIEAVKNLIDSL